METVAEADAFAENFNLRSLSDACLVVDALGPATRQALLLEFTESQLAPYENLFGPQSDHFTLDEVDRRWAWIKRLVRSVDSKFATVCPPHWGVTQRLCLHFNEKTRRHLVTMLTELGDDIDVTALLKALQSALKFEHDMRTHFEEVCILFFFAMYFDNDFIRNIASIRRLRPMLLRQLLLLLLSQIPYCQLLLRLWRYRLQKRAPLSRL